jgi:hypothetical protein
LSRELFRYAGWAAYLSAAASIATSLTAMLFFAKGQPWGSINDSLSVLQMLFMLPLAPHAASFSLLAAWMGAIGLLGVGVLQALLVLGRVGFRQQIGPAVGAGMVVGLWLLAVAVLSLGSGALPSAVAWWGVISGAGYLVTALGYFLGGQDSKVFRLGAILVLLGSALWAILLGNALLSRGAA